MGMLLSLLLVLATSGNSVTNRRFSFPESVLVGEYEEGDGYVFHGLTITADHHFAAHEFTDTKAEGDESGTWTYQGDVLVLSSLADKYAGVSVHRRLIPIAWGRAVYLVNEAEVPGLLASVDHLLPIKPDPRSLVTVPQASGDVELDWDLCRHFRKIDEEKMMPIPRDGEIVFPPRFVDFYLHGPVTAKVTAILPDGTVNISCLIPGRLHSGMAFVTQDFSDVEVRIKSLNGHGGTGHVNYSYASSRYLRKGEILTTGTRYNRVFSLTDAGLAKPPRDDAQSTTSSSPMVIQKPAK